MTTTVWEDLAIAMLSVNRYSLEKTYSTAQSLKREGIFDPSKLAGRTLEETEEALRRGGYDRGEFLTRLFAERLLSLAMFVVREGIDESERILKTGDEKRIWKFLAPINGVGPQVVENFMVLRQGSPESSET